MIKATLNAIARGCGVSDREAVLYLVLATVGWLYIAYEYLYVSGLGVAVPKYAGY